MPPKQTTKKRIVRKGNKKYLMSGKKILASKSVKNEISKIAKSAVNKVAEKKYMNPAEYRGLAPHNVNSVANPNTKVSVLGFVTGTNRDSDNNPMLYGDSEINPLYCLRPYNADRLDVTPDDSANNFIVGKEIQPFSSKTQIRLSRNAASQDILTEGNTGGLHENPPTPDTPPPQYPLGLMENCPVYCRVIRVTPKLASGIQTEIDPNNDLFINEKGNPFGIHSGDFQERELAFYKVNTRRYTKLGDMSFTIQNPLAVNYTWAPSAMSHDPNAVVDQNAGWWVPNVTNGSSNCEKHLTFYHQLTQKKHGIVRYQNPLIELESDTALTGHRREFVFLHFYYKGGDNISRNAASNLLRGPVDIDIDILNTTKFTDV